VIANERVKKKSDDSIFKVKLLVRFCMEMTCRASSPLYDNPSAYE
jgi:hypothetical protein